jgi:RNA recognition motif-containing protein
MSIRLYIGNLPKEVERQELQTVFAEAGESITAKLITDRKTGKCRGFGFVTVPTDEQADQIIEKFNGYMFKENPLKIEKALPKTKGKSDKPEKPEKAEKSDSDAPQSSNPNPVSPPTRSPSNKNSNRRRGDKRRSENNNNNNNNYQSDASGSQPDPRWANALAELKERLAAQTAG